MFSVCSFCEDRPVVAWFEGPAFVTSVDAPEKVRAEEAWLVCGDCLLLVQAGDRDGLVLRATRHLKREGDHDLMVELKRLAHDRFWAARSRS